MHKQLIHIKCNILQKVFAQIIYMVAGGSLWSDIYTSLYKLNSVEYLWWWDGKNDDYNPLHHGIFLNAEWCDSVTHYTMRNNLNCEWRGSRLISQLHCCFLAPLCTKTNGWWSRPKFQKMALTSQRCNNSWTDAQGP